MNEYFNHVEHVKVALTHNCNLGCPYCADNPSKGRNSLFPYEDEFIKWCKERPKLISILLFGGEPLISTRWFEFYQKIRNELPNIRIGIFTNGTIFNDKVKQFLKDDKTFAFVTRSSFKETHDKYRVFKGTNDGTWDIVTENIKKYYQLAGNRITIANTVSQSDLYRAADGIIEDLQLVDVGKFNLIKSEEGVHDFDLLLSCLKKIADYLVEHPNKCVVNFSPYSPNDKISFKRDYNKFRQGTLPFDHLHGIANLMVDLDGKIYPTFPIEVGKYYMGDIFGDIKPDIYNMYVNTKERGICQNCDIKYMCSPCYDYQNVEKNPIPYKKDSFCQYAHTFVKAVEYYFEKAKEKGLLD